MASKMATSGALLILEPIKVMSEMIFLYLVLFAPEIKRASYADCLHHLPPVSPRLIHASLILIAINQSYARVLIFRRHLALSISLCELNLLHLFHHLFHFSL